MISTTVAYTQYILILLMYLMFKNKITLLFKIIHILFVDYEYGPLKQLKKIVS